MIEPPLASPHVMSAARWWQNLAQDWRAGILALFVFVLCLIAFQCFPEGAQATDRLLVVLLPIIVFALTSGRISEFSAPGGWQAKFTAIAATPVAALRSLNWADMRVNEIQKADPKRVAAALSSIDQSSAIVLTMQFGAGAGYYNLGDMQVHLDVLSTRPTFRGLVVLDEAHRLIAYAPASAMDRLFRGDQDGPSELIDRISKGSDEDRVDLLKRFKLTPLSVTSDTSLAHALQAMSDAGSPSIAVVAGNQTFVGVLDRDRVVADLLMALVGPAKPKQ